MSRMVCSLIWPPRAAAQRCTKKRLPRMTVKSWRKGRIKNGSITAVIDIERNFFLKASFGLMQLHTPAGARDILSNLSDTFFVLFKHASPR